MAGDAANHSGIIFPRLLLTLTLLLLPYNIHATRSLFLKTSSDAKTAPPPPPLSEEQVQPTFIQAIEDDRHGILSKESLAQAVGGVEVPAPTPGPALAGAPAPAPSEEASATGTKPKWRPWNYNAVMYVTREEPTTMEERIQALYEDEVLRAEYKENQRLAAAEKQQKLQQAANNAYSDTKAAAAAKFTTTNEEEEDENSDAVKYTEFSAKNNYYKNYEPQDEQDNLSSYYTSPPPPFYYTSPPPPFYYTSPPPPHSQLTSKYYRSATFNEESKTGGAARITATDDELEAKYEHNKEDVAFYFTESANTHSPPPPRQTRHKTGATIIYATYNQNNDNIPPHSHGTSKTNYKRRSYHQNNYQRQEDENESREEEDKPMGMSDTRRESNQKYYNNNYRNTNYNPTETTQSYHNYDQAAMTNLDEEDLP
ncbi:unnamed protein product [Cuscuta europaea]|uniref:Uncharacterized protein n=1 Tax=Cuscuta europaea TaxID=41803 RepID=A0A9P1EKL4_CUSEU|nr:unnamed protein product [Cuscuta europaea]